MYLHLKCYLPVETVAVLLCGLFLSGIAYAAGNTDDDYFARARHNMVENDLKSRVITDPAVLNAMGKVKRHLFVDKDVQRKAYADYPLPISCGQTISQPYIVALMTQSLKLQKKDKVLEIGTGSGYQAAILAEIVAQVFSVEIKKQLADRAVNLIKSLGYKNITIKAGDGYVGWQEHAPFDAIILTCAVDKIPKALIRQLKQGGKIILPLGSRFYAQSLSLGIKKGDELVIENIISVRFVPMTGEADKKK